MRNLIDTGRIRIIKLPDGEAPKEIRKAWIGQTLPCSPILGWIRSEHGVLSKKETPERYGFTVPQVAAIKILSGSDPQAVAYWKSNGFPQLGQYFVFEESEAVIISGVRKQKIFIVNDLDHPHGFGANCDGCKKRV